MYKRTHVCMHAHALTCRVHHMIRNSILFAPFHLADSATLAQGIWILFFSGRMKSIDLENEYTAIPWKVQQNANILYHILEKPRLFLPFLSLLLSSSSSLSPFSLSLISLSFLLLYLPFSLSPFLPPSLSQMYKEAHMLPVCKSHFSRDSFVSLENCKIYSSLKRKELLRISQRDVDIA